MTLVLKDRVKEQTTTTGTGTVTLGGALSGFDTFASVGNGNTTYYAIVHQTADEWEVGLGTYTAAGTLLSRDTVLESSNADAAVVFSAGTKDVFVTYPAGKSVYYNAAGNVGIGTSSPSSTLDIVDSVTNPIQIKFDSNASAASGRLGVGSTGNAIAVFDDNTVLESRTGGLALGIDNNNPILFYNTSSRIERMRITSTGNVGIGTSAPAHELDVLGASDPIIRVRATGSGTGDDSLIRMAVTNASASNYIQFGDNSDSDAGYIRYAHSNDSLYFATNAAVRMTIDSSGYVGIGTSSPVLPLHISSATPAIRLTDTDDGSDAQVGAAAGGLLVFDADIGNEVAGSAILFRVDGSSEKMRITDTGLVGIGTTAPGGNLHVQGAAGNQVRLYLTDGDATGTANSLLISKSGTTSFISDRQASSQLWFGTADTERMRIDSSGNVGIGLTNGSGYGKFVAKGGKSGTATSSAAFITPGAAQAEVADLALYSTFTGTGDNGPRRTADILAGMTANWGSEYLTLNVGNNGAANDTQLVTSEKMRIDSSGNVGIGVTPTAALGALQVTTGTNGTASKLGNGAFISSFNGGGFLSNSASLNSAGVWTARSTGSSTIGATAASGLVFYTNTSLINGNTFSPTERMRIDTSGNVGIGTSSPGEKLNVSTGGSEYAIQWNSTGSNNWVLGSSSNRAYIVNKSTPLEVLTLLNGGNVGIGTSSPSTIFHIDDNAASGTGLLVTGGGGGLPLATFTRDLGTTGTVIIGASGGDPQIQFASAGNTFSIGTDYADFKISDNTSIGTNDRFTINSTGNVGIGTTSPVKKLHVDGPALATIGTLTDGATITPNFDSNQNFSVTLAGNRTLANPNNIDAGQTGSIFITQDGTGSRTLSFGSYWDFAGGTAPTLSTAAGAVDRIDYIVRTGTSIHAVATLNLS